MTPASTEAILAALREGVTAGADLARQAFHDREFEVEIKDDGTPVTSADVAVERAMRARLAARTPDIALVGEESGGSEQVHDERYIAIDPIDGTSNFLRGVPFFGVTAAYIEAGAVVAGAVADPIHGDTFWAARGQGAYRNGRRLHVSGGARTLAGATVVMATEILPSRLRGAFLQEVLSRVARHQAIRSVALEVTGMAAGWSDAILFSNVAVWDFAAAALVLEEAGGRWSDFEGHRPDLGHPGTRCALLACRDPHLHGEILSLMATLGGTD